MSENTKLQSPTGSTPPPSYAYTAAGHFDECYKQAINIEAPIMFLIVGGVTFLTGGLGLAAAATAGAVAGLDGIVGHTIGCVLYRVSAYYIQQLEEATDTPTEQVLKFSAKATFSGAVKYGIKYGLPGPNIIHKEGIKLAYKMVEGATNGAGYYFPTNTTSEAILNPIAIELASGYIGDVLISGIEAAMQPPSIMINFAAGVLVVVTSAFHELASPYEPNIATAIVKYLSNPDIVDNAGVLDYPADEL